MQARGEQHRDKNFDEQNRHVWKNRGSERSQHHHGEHYASQPFEPSACGTQWRFRRGHAAHRRAGASEQPPGPHHQYDRHHDELRHEREAAQRKIDPA